MRFNEIREAFEKFKEKMNYSDKTFAFAKLYPYSLHQAGSYYEGYTTAQQKAQTEIEELTESLGTYYDLNMKLEQQIEQWNDDYAKLKTYASSLEDTIENMKYEDEFH